MTWKIDPTHTRLEFEVRYMMINRVRGQFNGFCGTVDIDPANPTAGHVTGTVQVASINTHVKERDVHLRSADFFDVVRYPKMTFRSSRIEPTGDNQYQLHGHLTIKDVTRPIVFNITDGGRRLDPWGRQRWGLSGVAHISRAEFGLTWNLVLECGGWLIGDEITLITELQLIQEQPQPDPLALA